VAVDGIVRYKSQRKVVMKVKLEFRQRCERNERGRRVGDDGAHLYLGRYPVPSRKYLGSHSHRADLLHRVFLLGNPAEASSGSVHTSR